MPTRPELANAVRALSMDAVQKARSGHPGAPMGMADIAEVLWNDFFSHNPENPDWFNRDRFVLSNGHASMLIYSLLHLSGYGLPIQELENFRQFESMTPGHPEHGDTPGVETTTGPLGQGIGNAVGMAIAEKTLAAQYNRENHSIVDHYTYVFAGDGCLMEGVSHEVCSLAGTLQLAKLIVLYDDNGISIDGEVGAWFSDDTRGRFEAYGWQVIDDVDGHDADAVKAAIESARGETNKPTLIACRTIIGKGAPNKEGSESVHGAPLGDAEIAAVREQIGWPHDPFVIPEDIRNGWDARARGVQAEQEWQAGFDAYAKAYPQEAAELERRVAGQLPADFTAQAQAYVQKVNDDAAKVATRKASQNAIEALAPALPELLGGSADLTGSNLTAWSGTRPISAKDASGNYVYYGVREFGMGAIMNGMLLHGGVRPYGGTFLVFMDYMRNAVRMAALMSQPAVYVFTHDSIGLGEDGPTHQPVEHLATLRVTPGLSTWRPADAVETAVAWEQAILNTEGPTALILSRQGLAHQRRDADTVSAIRRGGYILEDCEGEPELILIATGSEVELANQARIQLAESGRQVRLVSFPCVDRFEAQSQSYRDSVLPPGVRTRIAIESAHADFWYKYTGLDGAIIGMRSFGASAPADELMSHFGFTSENIVAVAEGLLAE